MVYTGPRLTMAATRRDEHTTNLYTGISASMSRDSWGISPPRVTVKLTMSSGSSMRQRQDSLGSVKVTLEQGFFKE
jgi:hypothetical protein